MSDRNELRGEGAKVGLIVSRFLPFVLALLLICPVVLRPTWWLWKPGAPASDLAVTHWPNAHFTRRMVWEERRFPVWRPTIMSGTPFAANPLAALYYPPNWPFLFRPPALAGTGGIPTFPLAVGFNLSALVHLALAGVTMYVLMRRGLGTGVWAGLVAAVAYQASPKLLAHLSAGHVGWTQAWSWLPLVVLCTLKSCQPGSRLADAWALGAGAALAAQFCADVRLSAYTLIAVASLILALALRRLSRQREPTAGSKEEKKALTPAAVRPIALILTAFAGLSACQWLPGLALLPETTRSTMTLSDAAVWSLPWRYLGGLLLADHGGFQEWMTYVGISTLTLAWVGARGLWRDHHRRWLGGWLIGLGAFAIWFSLGKNGGLFQVLWHSGIVPGLGLLRVPPRAWVLVAFTTAVLAGLGVQAVRRENSRPPASSRWKRALLLGAAAFPPMFAIAYGLTMGKPPLNLVMFGLIAPLTIGLCSAPSRISARTRDNVSASGSEREGTDSTSVDGTPGNPPWLGIAAVLLVVLDLLVVDFTLVEARAPESVFAAGRAAAEWLGDQPGRFRVYSPSYSIPQHVAERYAVELADGVDPLQLQSYAEYLIQAAGLERQQGYSVTLPPFPESSAIQTALADVDPNTDMLGQLGVRYVAAAFPMAHSQLDFVRRFDEVYIYENKDAHPPGSEALDPRIALADGRELFRYRPWPVYVGCALSGLTLMGVVGALWWVCQDPGKGTPPLPSHPFKG